MSASKDAGDLSPLLLDIYKKNLEAMKADPEKVNVSMLREVREFLKMHHIELDASSAPMQELKNDADDLAAYRNRRGSSA